MFVLFQRNLTQWGSLEFLELSFCYSLLHFLTCHCYQPHSFSVILYAFSKIQIHFLAPSFFYPPWTRDSTNILWVSFIDQSGLQFFLLPMLSSFLQLLEGSQIQKPIFPVVHSNETVVTWYSGHLPSAPHMHSPPFSTRLSVQEADLYIIIYKRSSIILTTNF